MLLRIRDKRGITFNLSDVEAHDAAKIICTLLQATISSKKNISRERINQRINQGNYRGGLIRGRRISRRIGKL